MKVVELSNKDKIELKILGRNAYEINGQIGRAQPLAAPVLRIFNVRVRVREPLPQRRHIVLRHAPHQRFLQPTRTRAVWVLHDLSHAAR